MIEIDRPDIAHERLEADVCVVGGGMAGLGAALAAARDGARTVLVQDRPVLGGNASGEVRMWICGAHGRHVKETGLLEELQLENLWRNPARDFALWDSVLWGHAAHQPRLRLLLNTTCLDATVEDGHLRTIGAWTLTAQTRWTIAARMFVDASGDAILAALTGARHRIGREARTEFGEPIAPEEGDRRTMGNTILLQTHRCAEPRPFRPPSWAYRFRGPEDLPHRLRGVRADNFWWLELGGLDDTIRDAEAIRDELLRVAYGVWDYIKNVAPEREQAACWDLHFMGALPGKRESRRYVGDHILTQHDIEAGGRFDDVVAYGGWTMDDHHPAGLLFPGPPTTFHPAPSPYGIPYRCLCSRSLPNLLCAGRNLSATHAALSSTRVMATCALLGQAAGTAASFAARRGVPARAVPVAELQRRLQDDDIWLPGRLRPPTPLLGAARLAGPGGVELLRDGWDRDEAGNPHAWEAAPGDAVELRWDGPRDVPGLRLVLDSDLNDAKRQACSYPQPAADHALPRPLARAFSVAVEEGAGRWRTVHEETENRRRLVHVPVRATTRAVRLTVHGAWGGPATPARVFSLDVLPAADLGRLPDLPAGEAWRDRRARVDPADLREANQLHPGARHHAA